MKESFALNQASGSSGPKGWDETQDAGKEDSARRRECKRVQAPNNGRRMVTVPRQTSVAPTGQARFFRVTQAKAIGK
ncbi:MAG: hypothetical protein QOE88_2794 [Verrucomicrobiota bacterium]|nr:hypothetical protein [Verrucomicrobiota bacterium]